MDLNDLQPLETIYSHSSQKKHENTVSSWAAFDRDKGFGRESEENESNRNLSQQHSFTKSLSLLFWNFFLGRNFRGRRYYSMFSTND
jgi:hypothetical protein